LPALGDLETNLPELVPALLAIEAEDGRASGAGKKNGRMTSTAPKPKPRPKAKRRR
jgi:hypothetical protein